MPWSAKDSKKFTKAAHTEKERRQWAHIANKALKSGDSKEKAIMKASGVIKKSVRK